MGGVGGNSRLDGAETGTGGEGSKRGEGGRGGRAARAAREVGGKGGKKGAAPDPSAELTRWWRARFANTGASTSAENVPW